MVRSGKMRTSITVPVPSGMRSDVDNGKGDGVRQCVMFSPSPARFAARNVTVVLCRPGCCWVMVSNDVAVRPALCKK